MSPENHAAAVEMLPLPMAAGLASAQIDGTTCVWCGRTPDGGGIKLGPRIRRTAEGLVRWHPRACRACAGRQAARVYKIHVTTCPRCTHRDYCPDSQALYALALECRPLGAPNPAGETL